MAEGDRVTGTPNDVLTTPELGVETTDVTPLVLSRVMCWENGMVMAFDQLGKQMPEFQGKKADVWDKICDAATKDTLIEGDVVPLRWRNVSPQPR